MKIQAYIFGPMKSSSASRVLHLRTLLHSLNFHLEFLLCIAHRAGVVICTSSLPEPHLMVTVAAGSLFSLADMAHKFIFEFSNFHREPIEGSRIINYYSSNCQNCYPRLSAPEDRESSATSPGEPEFINEELRVDSSELGSTSGAEEPM